MAILFGESAGPALTARLAQDGERVLSAVSYVETGTVLAGRMRDDPMAAIPLLDEFLAELGIAVRAVDESQMRLAMRARIEFGRGFGQSAGLNRRCLRLRPGQGARGSTAVHRRRLRRHRHPLGDVTGARLRGPDIRNGTG